jgi:predicted HicB family RNase H-like nuclease
MLIIQDLVMSKTKLLNIRIDPELKKGAKKLAEADGRSLSNWVTALIASRVKEAEKKEPKSAKKD